MSETTPTAAELPRASRNGPTPSPVRPVLELLDTVKEYPGTPPVRALDGVTFTITRTSSALRHG